MKISQRVFNSQSGAEYMVEMVISNVKSATTPKVGNLVIVHMFCTLSHGALHLCEAL